MQLYTYQVQGVGGGGTNYIWRTAHQGMLCHKSLPIKGMLFPKSVPIKLKGIRF